MTNPQRFESIQEFLAAEKFEKNGDYFVKGDVKFPVTEIIGHTVSTFVEKMRVRGWLGARTREELAGSLFNPGSRV